MFRKSNDFSDTHNLRPLRLIVMGCLLLGAATSVPARAGTLFFDDFNGPTLNPAYQAALPNAPWRYSTGPQTQPTSVPRTTRSRAWMGRA